MTPRIIKTWLTNSAYGYPTRGHTRRVKPGALLCLHISGNKRTAAMEPIAGTRAEVAYSDRKGSTGPSAHDYVARDGTIFRCIKPANFAAWSNGDVAAPDVSKRGIREMLALMQKGHNANEFFYREIEMTGHPSGYDPTPAQLESVAWQLARDSILTGMAILAGRTVLLHAHINGVDRRNCPFEGDRDAKLERLCQRARIIRRKMTAEPDPEPEPDPGEPSLEDQLADALGRLDTLRDQREKWLEAANAIDTLIAPYTED